MGKIIKSIVFLNQFYVAQCGLLSPLLFFIFIKCLNKVLHHCYFLYFAHDINLFMRIHSKDDCYKLLSDIDSFVTFFVSLSIPMN